jgi:anti-anti-sigma factor
MSPREGDRANGLLYYRYRLAPPSGFEYVSRSATELVGYTPEEHYADPLLGFRLIHPDDAPVLALLAQSPGNLAHPVILRWRRKDGSILWTEQHNEPLFDRHGRWVGIEGFAVDVTQRELGARRTAAGLGRSRYPFWMGVRGAGAGDLLQGSIEELDQVVIVRMEGEVDLSTASILRGYLAQAIRSNRPVILDLSRVEYFDASGLRVVEDCISDFRRRSVKFVLVPSRIVKRVISLLGLESGMATAESLAAAIRAITEQS